MNTKKFVKIWKTEKEDMLSRYINESSGTSVSHLVKSMNLSQDQKVIMDSVVNTILTDSFYTFLLGLDGCANIGGIQQTYTIHDEAGNLISELGEIEAEAWEQFHGEN